jgi:glycosyltransferase involved in cell wall biosynthesis
MKILIHSNGPMEPTGYGMQTRMLLPRLKEMGHEPIVSAFSGLHGSALMWDGTPILPSGMLPFGVDMVVPHARINEVDLTLFLMDFREMMPAARDLHDMNTAAWIPLDTYPISKPEAHALRASATRPIAMSRFGLAQLSEYGFPDPLYVPHAVDTGIFHLPDPQERAKTREELGWTDRFVIGINAANSDAMRKGWPEQFAAFSMLRKEHPEALLAVHTIANSRTGLNLPQLAEDLGIRDAVWFPDPYMILAGNASAQDMAQWYGLIDVLSLCSYGEGFGVPAIEAQACGTPVISTRGSAMTELNPLGYLVEGTAFWNHVHRAWWTRPDIDAIADAYASALKSRPTERDRDALVKHARTYDTRHVAATYWAPVLRELEAK